MLDLAGEDRSVAVKELDEEPEKIRILISQLDRLLPRFLEFTSKTVGEPF